MPIVPVVLTFNGKSVKTIALIDSGSSSTIISTEIAEQLSIPWRSLPEFSGGSVAGEYSFRRVRNGIIEIAQTNGPQLTAAFDIVKVKFPFPCLLGQDFFEYTKITFERHKKSFEIKFREDIN